MRSHAETFGQHARHHGLGVEELAQHDPFGHGDVVGGELKAEGVRDVVRDEAQPVAEVSVQRAGGRLHSQAALIGCLGNYHHEVALSTTFRGFARIYDNVLYRNKLVWANRRPDDRRKLEMASPK